MSKFKSEGGNWYTQALFLETAYMDTSCAVYTLKDEDHEHKDKLYPSLKRLYLECGDVTEYEFATTYLGGWDHWKRICNNKQFTKYIDAWREELEIKLRCEDIKQMRELAKSDKGGQQAKWLAEKGWEEKKRGRPSKAEKQAEVGKQTRISQELEEDLKRISH